MATDTIIMAAAGGDPKQFIYLRDNVALSDCFEIYGISAAWSYEPEKKDSK